MATVNGVSRFVGILFVEESFFNFIYIADIKDECCTFTMLELRDYEFDPQFYCAYAFGENIMPEVFVWGLTKD